MAKNHHDLGAAAYNQPGTFRTCNHDVAKRCGWLAAAVFDHLQSLEVRHAADRVERDGRLWFYRPVSEVAAHVHAKRDAFDGAVARLEEHGFLHRLKMKGRAKTPCMHWSVDWSAFAPNAENPQTVEGGKCGKPANANAENPQTVEDIPLPKETDELGETTAQRSDDSGAPAFALTPPPPKRSQKAQNPRRRAEVVALWEHYCLRHDRDTAPQQRSGGLFGGAKANGCKKTRAEVIRQWLNRDPANTVDAGKRLIDGHRQKVAKDKWWSERPCVSFAFAEKYADVFLANAVGADEMDTDAWLKGLGVK